MTIQETIEQESHPEQQLVHHFVRFLCVFAYGLCKQYVCDLLTPSVQATLHHERTCTPLQYTDETMSGLLSSALTCQEQSLCSTRNEWLCVWRHRASQVHINSCLDGRTPNGSATGSAAGGGSMENGAGGGAFGRRGESRVEDTCACFVNVFCRAIQRGKGWAGVGLPRTCTSHNALMSRLSRY